MKNMRTPHNWRTTGLPAPQLRDHKGRFAQKPPTTKPPATPPPAPRSPPPESRRAKDGRGE